MQHTLMAENRCDGSTSLCGSKLRGTGRYQARDVPVSCHMAKPSAGRPASTPGCSDGLPVPSSSQVTRKWTRPDVVAAWEGLRRHYQPQRASNISQMCQATQPPAAIGLLSCGMVISLIASFLARSWPEGFRNAAGRRWSKLGLTH